jgi:D-sedoheptulose 7-phosphate isomerase
LAAARTAKRKGALVVTFTGAKHSKLERLADICLCADSKSTARSQEIHQLAYHIICKLVEENFAGKRA